MMIINAILIAVGIYLLCGVLFAIPFVVKGVQIIDPDGAHEAKWGFRVIIIPGTIIFWPLLLKKWIKAKKQND
jgi:hypothetical protein